MFVHRSLVRGNDYGIALRSKREDAVLIHFGEHVVGRYFTEYEAREVLASLATAIDRENQYFEFPRSLKQDTLERKRDARTKRKGGS